MLMKLDHNILMLTRDARSHYDAYEVLQIKTRELGRIQSNKIEVHQKKFKGLGVPMPITEHDKDLSTPALVCLAFSIELHVKLLLHTYDTTVRGHNIGKLIKKLPEDEIAHISNHPYFYPTQQGEGFFENIDKASNLFIRTRYYYEKMGTLYFNTGFCITLAKVIRKRIVERVPYLRDDLGLFSE
jgi:hypothetical protein